MCFGILLVHIGLPAESFHRFARLVGQSGSVFLMLLQGLSSPLNRQVMWAVITGNSDLSKTLGSSGVKFEVSLWTVSHNATTGLHIFLQLEHCTILRVYLCDGV